MEGKDKKYDWALLFYLPYNNNLSFCAEPILSALRQGVQSVSDSAQSKAAASNPPKINSVYVAAQVKTRQTPQMLRHIFAFGPEGHLEQSNPVPKSADSADPQVLEQFIMDTEADVPAHNWVVAVLGHGGGPDEVCPDAKAGAPKHWMPVSSMANAIAGLHNRSGGRVRLLYLQNCCKSTVLSMLSTQASADYVLASQPVLGAPNSYYAGLIRTLSTMSLGHTKTDGAPGVANSGLEVARAIVQAEDSWYYSLLACFETKRLSRLLSACDTFFALVAHTLRRMDRAQLARAASALENTLGVMCIEYPANAKTDQYICLVGLCKSLAQTLSSDGGHAGAFYAASQEVMDSLSSCRVLRARSPVSAGYSKMSGLSVFWPMCTGQVGGSFFCSSSDHEVVWSRTGLKARMPGLVDARAAFGSVSRWITARKRRVLKLQTDKIKSGRKQRKWANSRLRIRRDSKPTE